MLRRRLPHSSSSLPRAGRPRQQHKVIATRREPQPRLTAGGSPPRGRAGAGAGSAAVRACGSARVCALAPARGCGSGGRARVSARGSGLGRLRSPPRWSPALSLGTSAATLAPKARSEHTTALRRCALSFGPCVWLLGPWPAHGCVGSEPAPVSGSLLEPDTGEHRVKPAAAGDEGYLGVETLAGEDRAKRCVLDPHLGRPATVVIRFTRILRLSGKSVTQEENCSAPQSLKAGAEDR